MLGLVGLLAACHGGSGLSQDTIFNAKDEPESSRTGLIVVGLRVVNEPVQKTILGDFPTHSIYDVHFREVTADGYFGRNYRQVQVCDSIRALLGGILSNCQPDKLQYKVLSVPSGRYTLEYIGYQAGNTRVVTNFNSAGGDGLFSKRAVQNPNRSFNVSAGSIVYVGDLEFFFDPTSLAAQMALGRRDAAAIQALASYPNVHGQMMFQSATGGPTRNLVPSDPVPGELLPIEGALR